MRCPDDHGGRADFPLPGSGVYPKDCKGSRQKSLPARKLAEGLSLCRAKKSARPSVPTEISLRCRRSAQRQSIFHRSIRYCRRTRQLFILCSPYCSCRRNTRPDQLFTIAVSVPVSSNVPMVSGYCICHWRYLVCSNACAIRRWTSWVLLLSNAAFHSPEDGV